MDKSKKDAKKIFILYGHPEEVSFCGELLKIAKNTFEQQGHLVQISDLYRMNFKVGISIDDYNPTKETPKEPVNFEKAQTSASELNTFNQDVEQEIDKLLWCDYFIIISPLYWGSVSAVIRGWMERVLVKGKIWEINNWYDTGFLKGKKALLVITTGGAEKDFQIGGFSNISMEAMLHHITWNTLYFCGLDVLPIYKFFRPMAISDEERREELKNYKEYLTNIENMKKIY